MLNSGTKYLKFQSGPYGLLIAIPYIVEIFDFRKELRKESGNSATAYQKTMRWNDMDLPCIDMRSALGIETTATHDPAHVLVLRSTTEDTPFALILVDEVSHIMEIEEAQWYALNGINPRLDVFFDRACPDTDTGKILMRLAPAEQWATKNIEATNAH